MLAIMIATLLTQPAIAAPAPGLAVHDCRAECGTPGDAIEHAAAAAPDRARAGYYRITVRAVGSQDGRVYINSERDYRDRSNLSLSFGAADARQLTRMLGGRSIAEALVGTDLIVHGRPQKVRIDFLRRSRPTGRYYFQTHIVIRDVPKQVFRPAA